MKITKSIVLGTAERMHEDWDWPYTVVKCQHRPGYMCIRDYDARGPGGVYPLNGTSYTLREVWAHLNGVAAALDHAANKADKTDHD